MTKVLVCGAGSVGRRHIKNLIALGAEVGAWRRRTVLADELAREFSIPVLLGLADAIDWADAVVVATDTDRHMEPALAAARAGKSIFLEKPISHSRDQVDVLEDLVARNQSVVEVGCQLRTHPCLVELHHRLARGADGPIFAIRAAVGQRLDTWRPGTDYRECYSAHAARGGGPVMDLIHEIDLVGWLVGRMVSVSAAVGRVSNLAIEAEDIACLTLVAASGALAQVELDMVSPVYRRRLEVVCRDAIYRFDDSEGKLRRETPDGTSVVAQVAAGFARNDLFLTHMKHFLQRLRDPATPPVCPLAAGVAALDVALAARKAAAAGVTCDLRS